MSNPSKAKGTAWENAVVDYLTTHGFPYCERRALRGVNDGGDLCGIPGYVISCKAERQIDLAGYLDEVETQRDNAHADYAVVVVKRRRRATRDAYVVMSLEQFAELTRDPSSTVPAVS